MSNTDQHNTFTFNEESTPSLALSLKDVVAYRVDYYQEDKDTYTVKFYLRGVDATIKETVSAVELEWFESRWEKLHG